MSSAIPEINTPPSGAPTSADRMGSPKLDKQEFLKLLMAQLANQDPTAPSDSQAFVAQLAQFAGLEAAQGTNSRLDTLLLAQASSGQMSAVNFVGKQIEYRTDALNLQAGLTTMSSVSLAGKADKVTVAVMDGSGRTVRTMQMGAQEAGTLAITWDGNDDGGTRQPPGSYRLKVTATDKSGNTVNADLRGDGVVTGVLFENGIPQLKVNGSLVKMSEVISINERNTP